MVFHPLRGHTNRCGPKKYPQRLIYLPPSFPYLFPRTVTNTSATPTIPQPAEHTNKASLTPCSGTWPLSFPEVQAYITLVNANGFSGNQELFLNDSSPHLFFSLLSCVVLQTLLVSPLSRLHCFPSFILSLFLAHWTSLSLLPATNPTCSSNFSSTLPLIPPEEKVVYLNAKMHKRKLFVLVK